MNDNDKKIRELKKKITALRSEMGEKPKLDFVTKAVVCFDRTKLSLQEMDSDDIVTVYSVLKTECENYTASAQKLGFKNYKFKYLGHSFEEWEQDLFAVANFVRWKEKDWDLKVFEDKLNRLLSKDAKTAEALDEIEKSLS